MAPNRHTTKRKQQVDVTVMNNLLTLCRAILCIFVFVILLGALWSAGSMKSLEYLILTILIVCSSFGVYACRPNNQNRGSLLEKLAFYFGLFVILGGLLLNIVGIIRSPGVVFLLIILAPFIGAYTIRRPG